MFDDYANLRPLKAAADILAKYDGWGPLYNEAQLAQNDVKVTAASCVFFFCLVPHDLYSNRYTDMLTICTWTLALRK